MSAIDASRISGASFGYADIGLCTCLKLCCVCVLSVCVCVHMRVCIDVCLCTVIVICRISMSL